MSVTSGSTEAALPEPVDAYRRAAWFGPTFLLCFLVFLAIIAKFVPPPAEHWSTAEVYRFYTENSVRIRIGMTGVLLTGTLYVIWSVAVSKVMGHIEGRHGVLSTIELAAGILAGITILLFGVFFLTAAFRLDVRDARTVQLLNDLGWITFNLTVGPVIVQMVAFGTAVLGDRRVTPLYPRWLAWLAFLTSVTFLFVVAVPFVVRGPLAWHGLLTFWVAVGLYIVWAAPTMYFTLRAPQQLKREASADAYSVQREAILT